MLYSKHLSVQGYCKALLKEYYEDYRDFLSEEEIKKTIGYIINMVKYIIDQNQGESLDVALAWLSKIDHVTKEECIETSKQIGPTNAMSVLFSAAQKPPINAADLIQNNMKFVIKQQSKDQYLKFLNQMAIRSTKELASINYPKQHFNKRVTFGEDVAHSLQEHHKAAESEGKSITPDKKKFKAT